MLPCHAAPHAVGLLQSEYSVKWGRHRVIQGTSPWTAYLNSVPATPLRIRFGQHGRQAWAGSRLSWEPCSACSTPCTCHATLMGSRILGSTIFLFLVLGPSIPRFSHSLLLYDSVFFLGAPAGPVSSLLARPLSPNIRNCPTYTLGPRR